MDKTERQRLNAGEHFNATVRKRVRTAGRFDVNLLKNLSSPLFAKEGIIPPFGKGRLGRNLLTNIVTILASLFCLLLASCSLPRIIVLDDPLSPQEHLNLGVAYEKKAEYDPAIDEYNKASKKIPLAYVYLGNVYFQKNDFDDAEKSYRKAIDKDPSLADAYNNLAWLYYTKKENLAEAESLASKAVELDPKSATYHDTLVRIREVR